MDPVAATGWLVLVTVMGATIRFFWKVRRHGAPIALSVAGALGLFSGLITAGLGLGHLGGVATVELRRSPPRYDFRVYALLLLGVTLVLLGTRLAAASVGVARGEAALWRRAMWAAVALLVVNGPLAPIQGFAVAVSIFVSIGLVGLLAARARIAKAG